MHSFVRGNKRFASPQHFAPIAPINAIAGSYLARSHFERATAREQYNCGLSA
jgi:hypothetical protein